MHSRMTYWFIRLMNLVADALSEKSPCFGFRRSIDLTRHHCPTSKNETECASSTRCEANDAKKEEKDMTIMKWIVLNLLITFRCKSTHEKEKFLANRHLSRRDLEIKAAKFLKKNLF